MSIRLVWLGLALAVTGCAGAKPVIRTINDIAKDACALFFSEKQGISIEDAARGICATREVLDPFIREILKAQQLAGASAGRDAGAEPEDASAAKTKTVVVVVIDPDAGATSDASSGAVSPADAAPPSPDAGRVAPIEAGASAAKKKK